MNITTILSRFERKQAKNYSIAELNNKIKQCERGATQWVVIGNSQQANKYWEAVEYYKKLLVKLNK